MKYLILLMALMGTGILASSQSIARIKLLNDEVIKGEWLGMEDNNYLIGQEGDAVYYVPVDMVYKLKLKQPYFEFPKYDRNRSTVILGVTGIFNTTLGQYDEANQSTKNSRGAGIKLSVGYDWDHRYDVMFNTGWVNMNMGNQEIFIPTTLTARKYLTGGRYHVFAGIEVGYQWGVTNQWYKAGAGGIWHPASNWHQWNQPGHTRGSGPSVTPITGVRVIGKNGIDQVLNIGLHLQKFYSENRLQEADFTSVEIFYKRWQISLGIIF